MKEIYQKIRLLTLIKIYLKGKAISNQIIIKMKIKTMLQMSQKNKRWL